MEEAVELAARLASQPRRAIGFTKQLLQRSFGNSLADQLEAEAEIQTLASRTEDHLEGVRAFMEKRKPEFGGR